MVQIRFRCHSCGQKYRLDYYRGGDRFHCTKCQTELEIPTIIFPYGKEPRLGSARQTLKSHRVLPEKG